jgi:hypothetical protein
MYAIIFHAHQKLDRVAHRHLRPLLPSREHFPAIRQVLHFEATRGPDSAQLKRQEQFEQPWHFVDPFDPKDTELHKLINQHYKNLVKDLKRQDEVRAAFEAAWLAHALVDGLTPAHHYPYEKELELLRGEQRHSRKSLADRLYVKGDTLGKSVTQSYKLVGPKGLLTTHAMFEAGAYAIIAPLRLSSAKPTALDLAEVTTDGLVKVFKNVAREVAEFDLYGRFYTSGWTAGLSRDVRRELAPRMVRTITLAWYAAAHDAYELEL